MKINAADVGDGNVVGAAKKNVQQECANIYTYHSIYLRIFVLAVFKHLSITHFVNVKEDENLQ